ncbi:glycosyltransferase family 39 protein [Streptacidiphilus rugosus]|uniref:glycosyltransferase family 39 protein n=1 Tax=Streptacidiphilus rugosus TaxID=405783 RepID=UPI00068F5505|nr:glycosyltransferase family 39 protein [Streptacidiphilus rugosus]
MTPARLALGLIVAVFVCLSGWSIDSAGLETYYAAGVRSMAGSWHDFLFAAFDPRGTISMDKLPGSLWVQALSVRAFGFSVRSLVLPQVVEGALTVCVLYRAVRRVAGTRAGLTAAALFSVTPVVVSSTAGNLSEPLYLLCLVLAADAVMRYVLHGRRRAAVAAACWIALGFQAKMAEAWLVLPALAAAVLAGASAGRRGRAALKAVAVAVTAVALSLVWVVGISLVPAGSRPFVDGSTHDSVWEQVFLYNGVHRFDGDNLFGLRPLGAPSPSAVGAAAEVDSPALAAGLGTANRSKPSVERLFVGGLAPDTAWLLPGALLGAAVLLRRRPARWRKVRGMPATAGRNGDPRRAAAWLWVVWLLTFGGVFSASHLVHDYYLASLAPALAALTGLGASALWRAAEIGGRRAARLLTVAAVVAAGWSALLLFAGGQAVPGALVAGAGVLAGLGVGLVFRSGRIRRSATGEPPSQPDAAGSSGDRRRAAGLRGVAAVLALSALAGPLVADQWLLRHDGGPFDTPFAAEGTLARPSHAAEAARREMPGRYVGTLLPETPTGYWAALLSHGRQTQALESARHTRLLVFTSAAASSVVLSGVSSVEPIGGFSGDIPFPTVGRLEAELRSGAVFLAIVPGPDVYTSQDPRVLLIERLCRPLPSAAPTSHLLYSCASAGTAP